MTGIALYGIEIAMVAAFIWWMRRGKRRLREEHWTAKDDASVVNEAARYRQQRERGASAVEYGLLVAAIAAVIVGVVFVLGGVVRDKFSQVSSCITTSDPNVDACAPPPPPPANP